MKKSLLIWMFICACMKLQAQVNIITTIAGNGIGIYGDSVHDGGPATNAEVRLPEGLCLDNKGNIYIAEAGNNRVRKIDAFTGIITTIGGTGMHGFSGDNGPATAAEFVSPEAVFTDTAGNVYIADGGNSRIRKITVATGIVTSIAGSGPSGLSGGGDSGDGGPATNARINGPTGLCLDKSGNIYLADWGNNKIKKIDAATGIIATVAGNGSAVYPGDGLQATNVGISGPIQVFVDNFGDMFICDEYNHAVRRVSATTNIINTIAGNGAAGFSGDGGPATNAELYLPVGVFVDKQQDIFIAEWGNGTIRKIAALTGIIATVAGTGTRGFSGDGGPATNATLKCADVFLDKYGTIYIADYNNNRIRMVRDTTLRVGVATPPGLPKGEEMLCMFPTPARDELTIECGEESEVRIYNLVGQQILFFPFEKLRKTKNGVVLDVGYLPSGTYLVQVTDPSGYRRMGRFVKE